MNEPTEGLRGPSHGAEGPGELSLREHRRSTRRWSLLTIALATLLAAVAAITFSTAGASAQETETDGGTEQDESTETETETETHDCDDDGHHNRDRRHRGAMTDVLTEVLGIDADALAEARKAGSTLAEIAEDNGVAVDDVVDALVTAAQERAAEHGKEIDVDALTEKVTALVNGERPERGHGDRAGKRGHQWGRGMHGGDTERSFAGSAMS